MCLFCFCDQAMCVLLLSRDSALCFFPGLCFCSPLSVLPELLSPVYIIFSPSYLDVLPDLFLLCLVNSPCWFHLCIFSVPPSIYIDLCFCSSLSDRNSLSVSIYARILHFSE